MENKRPHARVVGLLRRLWPWLVGIAIIVVIARRVSFPELRAAIATGPHLLLAFVDLVAVILLLCSESFSTWLGLLVLDMRRPLGRIFVVRGATYLLYLLNYALGQGGFGYYLHKSGAPALRSVGAMLFLMGTNLATLLIITSIAYAVHPANMSNATMWWTLVIGCAGFAAYLVVIVISPGFIARREVLAPLFDAGLRGHALAIAGRVPHTALIVVGQWAAIRAWGIDVPFSVAITIMPAIAIASVIPISPAGLGTTQAAFVYFFSDYASGATDDARAANVFAFSIVHFAYGVLASLIVGVACTPFAKRAGALPSTTLDATPPG